jgi:hypothetical protein
MPCFSGITSEERAVVSSGSPSVPLSENCYSDRACHHSCDQDAKVTTQVVLGADGDCPLTLDLAGAEVSVTSSPQTRIGDGW